MTIKKRSGKAKGCRLQNHIRDRLRECYPDLHEDDITSRPMGNAGTDVILTPAARKLIPYAIEAKAYANFSIYKHYEQCKANTSEGETSLLVIRGDRKKALAVIDLEHFLELIKDDKES